MESITNLFVRCFCKGLALVRYLFASSWLAAGTCRNVLKPVAAQLGLISSWLKMYSRNHALDYRGNLANTLASWILIPRGRSFDPPNFGNRRHCSRNQTCHWTRSVGHRAADESA